MINSHSQHGSIQIGAVLPQTELPPDPAATRRYVEHLERHGYTHLMAYDHVLGASTDSRPGWTGAYSSTDPFLEVLTAFSWAAGFTRRLEFVTGVLILPQRQTALVAKQAATLDLLSGGRFRLGVGIGWNRVEYDGLNEAFHNRGKRMEEQIELMRALWMEPAITFTGKWHHIDDAGILPLPHQRPIPVWIGGSAEVAIRRAARIADGFFPQGVPGEQMDRMMDALFDELDRTGRDRATFGIDARITVSNDRPDEWRRQAAKWHEMGASHISLNTMKGGFTEIDQHLDALDRGREAIRQEIG